MARDPHGRIVRGEAAAFEKLSAALRHCYEAAMGLSQQVNNADFKKLTGGLRHCIEAIVEISTWRSDPRWFSLTPMFEKLLATANKMHTGAVMRGGSRTAPQAWLLLAKRFERIEGATKSLWAEAEHGAVQGHIH